MPIVSIKFSQKTFYNIQESSSIERANTLADDLILDQEKLQTEVEIKYGDKIRTINYWENFNNSLSEYIDGQQSKLEDLQYRYSQLYSQSFDKELPMLLNMQDQIYNLKLEILLSKQNFKAKTKYVAELSKYLFREPSKLDRLKTTIEYSLKSSTQISFENGESTSGIGLALSFKEINKDLNINLTGVGLFLFTSLGLVVGSVANEGTPDVTMITSVILGAITGGGLLHGPKIQAMLDKKSLPKRNKSTRYDLDFRPNKKISADKLLREKIRLQDEMSEKIEVFYKQLYTLSQSDYDLNYKKGRIDHYKDNLESAQEDLLRETDNDGYQRTIDLYQSRVNQYQNELEQAQAEYTELLATQKASFILAKKEIADLETYAKKIGLQIPIGYHNECYQNQKNKSWEKELQD